MRATHHCFSKKCFESTGIPGAEDPLLQDRPTRRFPVNINSATTCRNSRSDEDGYPERLLFLRSRDRRSPNGCFDHVLKQAQRVEELLFPLTPISQGLSLERPAISENVSRFLDVQPNSRTNCQWVEMVCWLGKRAICSIA